MPVLAFFGFYYDFNGENQRIGKKTSKMCRTSHSLSDACLVFLDFWILNNPTANPIGFVVNTANPMVFFKCMLN